VVTDFVHSLPAHGRQLAGARVPPVSVGPTVQRKSVDVLVSTGHLAGLEVASEKQLVARIKRLGGQSRKVMWWPGASPLSDFLAECEQGIALQSPALA
ncbi:unnamed protein product, partial [Prorocentrum cordatum]